MKRLFWVLPLICSFLLLSCTSEKDLKEKIKKIIKEDPSIILSVIKEKPVEFIETLQDAAKEAQYAMAKKRDEEQKKEMEEYYDKPLEPAIRSDENILGEKSAPLHLVMYSDFECPYCMRGYKTVKELMDKYGKNIKYTYKHLPLSFHKNAMNAAKYYEAIRLQDPQKAWKFHDLLFEGQRSLSKGDSFLKELAKKAGANLATLKKSLNSKKVQERIKEDQDEAGKFSFQGTPAYIINGIPVKGAYPSSHFVEIIEGLKKRGKVSID